MWWMLSADKVKFQACLVGALGYHLNSIIMNDILRTITDHAHVLNECWVCVGIHVLVVCYVWQNYSLSAAILRWS